MNKKLIAERLAAELKLIADELESGVQEHQNLYFTLLEHLRNLDRDLAGEYTFLAYQLCR